MTTTSRRAFFGGILAAFVRRWANHLGMRVADEDARQRALLDLVEAAARALREIG
jgi:hypothetical protein